MKPVTITFILSLALSLGAQAQDKPNGRPAEKPAAADVKPASGDAKARAQKILDAARQSKGPVDKLKAVREVFSRGDGTANLQGQSIDLTLTSYVQAPDKGRVEITIPAFNVTIVQGVNGAKSWMESPQGSGEMPEKMRDVTRKGLINSWFVDFLMPLNGSEIEAVALDDAQVNGKAADVVAVTIGDAKFTVYFDKQTHLALKTAYQSISQQTMEDIDAESLFDDYKDVDGIKLSHHVTVFNAGEKTLEVKRTEIKLNPGIAASKFEP